MKHSAIAAALLFTVALPAQAANGNLSQEQVDKLCTRVSELAGATVYAKGNGVELSRLTYKVEIGFREDLPQASEALIQYFVGVVRRAYLEDRSEEKTERLFRQRCLWKFRDSVK